ncbi:excalibur calcium-binding domain-containing protein [Ectopseudomonas mendocina]|uniref:Calcium-binding protein n=1 Tax=Ectopseudomonas mendocina TaxID=300 RepID=A0A2R3QRD7_ECTME|nr:excalibur calcium-binding domain-containing protein [Pseudomonas mendocina]AVO54359.1 calcium-binding protein [Pseudomonas mendocina]
MKNLIIALLIGAAVWQFYLKPNSERSDSSTSYPASQPTTSVSSGIPTSLTQPSISPARPATPSYSCDGRTHCSQMTSCAEATFFLRNCPGTKMDGNNDGVPCERQWCR